MKISRGSDVSRLKNGVRFSHIWRKEDIEHKYPLEFWDRGLPTNYECSSELHGCSMQLLIMDLFLMPWQKNNDFLNIFLKKKISMNVSRFLMHPTVVFSLIANSNRKPNKCSFDPRE